MNCAASSWPHCGRGTLRDSLVHNRNHEYGGNFGGPDSCRQLEEALLFCELKVQPAVRHRNAIPTADALKGIYTYVVSGTTNQLRTANVLDPLPRAADDARFGIAIDIKPIQVPTYARRLLITTSIATPIPLMRNNLNQYFPATRVDYLLLPSSSSLSPGTTTIAGNRELGAGAGIQRTNPFRIGYFVYSVRCNQL
jgi:hypothetical protein